jgi:cytochrome c oxidase cbb3-type subunit 4
MDINDLRSAVTLTSLLLFLGIAAWSWQRSRRAEFEEAAGLPFVEDETVGGERR